MSDTRELVDRMKSRTFLDLGENWTAVLRDHHAAADALTSLVERIEELTKERDEALDQRDVWMERAMSEVGTRFPPARCCWRPCGP